MLLLPSTISISFISQSIQATKAWLLYLLLGKNLALAPYTKSLEFRNGNDRRGITILNHS